MCDFYFNAYDQSEKTINIRLLTKRSVISI